MIFGCRSEYPSSITSYMNFQSVLRGPKRTDNSLMEQQIARTTDGHFSTRLAARRCRYLKAIISVESMVPDRHHGHGM